MHLDATTGRDALYKPLMGQQQCRELAQEKILLYNNYTIKKKKIIDNFKFDPLSLT